MSKFKVGQKVHMKSHGYQGVTSDVGVVVEVLNGKKGYRVEVPVDYEPFIHILFYYEYELEGI